MMDDFLQIIEEQACVIELQAERISKLTSLLVEKYEIEQADLDSIMKSERKENE